MPTTSTPASPSSHTRALWPIDPAPAYWPMLPNVAPAPAPATKRSRDLAALTSDDAARRAAREAVDLRYVRRMVAECAALVEGVSL